MYRVYVISRDGKPMDPTTRFGKVRLMLNDGRARVVQEKPFTIQLRYETKKFFTRKYAGGTDPGRENIGNAVITKDGDAPYADHITTRNKEIPDEMSDRKAHRQVSRRGERLARKRLAQKYDTTTGFPEGRRLPGYEKPVMLKDIINTEAKFSNKKRKKGWLTPTARQLLQTLVNGVDNICRLLPVTEWTIEANRFAFMLMEDNSVRGIDFQNGRLKGFSDVDEYIDHVQEGRCAVCGKPIEHHHHIVPRSEGGSDSPDNIIGLCSECHHRVHTNELDLSDAGRKKQYAHLSILNQVIPYFIGALIARFGEGNVHLVEGFETQMAREAMGLSKEHHTDAITIAALGAGIDDIHYDDDVYEIRQFRRQDRAIIRCQRERTYKLDNTTVAKNRKPREQQQGLALNQWFDKQVAEHGLREAERMRSRLTVIPSRRYYNNLDRLMSGAVFIYKGARHVMTGQLSNGAYFRAAGHGNKNFPAKHCRILTKNTGLVYL